MSLWDLFLAIGLIFAVAAIFGFIGEYRRKKEATKRNKENSDE